MSAAPRMFAILPRAADFRASPGGLMRDVVASLTVAVVALGFGLTSGMSASAGLSTAIHVYGVQAIPLLA